MNTDTNDTDNANGSSTDSNYLAAAAGRVEEDNERSCQAVVDGLGYFVLEDPDNPDATIRTQHVAEVCR